MRLLPYVVEMFNKTALAQKEQYVCSAKEREEAVKTVTTYGRFLGHCGVRQFAEHFAQENCDEIQALILNRALNIRVTPVRKKALLPKGVQESDV